MEIDMDLYNKLLKCGIFRAGPNIKAFNDRKKVLLDQDTILLWENGVAFGKYLDVLKTLLVRLQLISQMSLLSFGFFNTLHFCGLEKE